MSLESLKITKSDYFTYLNSLENVKLVNSSGIRNVVANQEGRFTYVSKGFFNYFIELIQSVFKSEIRKKNLQETTAKTHLLAADLHEINKMHAKLASLPIAEWEKDGLMDILPSNNLLAEMYTDYGDEYYAVRAARLYNQSHYEIKAWNSALSSKGLKYFLDSKLGYALPVPSHYACKIVNGNQLIPLKQTFTGSQQLFVKAADCARKYRWSILAKTHIYQMLVHGGLINKMPTEKGMNDEAQYLAIHAFSSMGKHCTKEILENNKNPLPVHAIQDYLEALSLLTKTDGTKTSFLDDTMTFSFNFKRYISPVFDQISRKYPGNSQVFFAVANAVMEYFDFKKMNLMDKQQFLEEIITKTADFSSVQSLSNSIDHILDGLDIPAGNNDTVKICIPHIINIMCKKMDNSQEIAVMLKNHPFLQVTE